MEKNVSKFEKDFIKNDDEDSNKGYILEVDVNIICTAIYHSYQKDRELKMQ